MNDIIAKISSYDIFNNLVPGAITAYLLKYLEIYSVDAGNVASDLLIYYFMGLVIGRIGSLFLEPALKKLGFINYAPYSAYVKASSKDGKLATLLEVNNQYRTILAVALTVLCAYFLAYLKRIYDIDPFIIKFLLICFLAVLFLVAYKKQTDFIRRRVESHSDNHL